MTEGQRNHAEAIANQVRTRLIKKYEKGAAEHKTRLWADYDERQLLKMALEEVLDLATYLMTLEAKLEARATPSVSYGDWVQGYKERRQPLPAYRHDQPEDY